MSWGIHTIMFTTRTAELPQVVCLLPDHWLSAQHLLAQLNTLYIKVTITAVIDNIKLSGAQQKSSFARNQCGGQAAFYM